MPVSRRNIECKTCKKLSPHFGHGMCSACLRNFKRKTKPSFYLGTCYSELSRRIKTYDPKRPNYYGLDKCTREEFIGAFENDPIFLKNWNNWKETDFKRGNAPSIDRIDNNKGYNLYNLQWLCNSDNGKKDWSYKMILDYKSEEEIHFDSQQELCNYLGTHDRIVIEILNKNNPGFIKGRLVYKIYA